MSTILQIEKVDRMSTAIPIPMTASEMHEALGNSVVFIDEFSHQESDARRKAFLTALSVNGCDVDFLTHEFRITDLPKFTHFLLNGTVAPKKKMNIVELAAFMDDTLTWLLGHYPTVLDGTGYANIYSAFRHYLYGRNARTDDTYMVVAVYYGKV